LLPDSPIPDARRHAGQCRESGFTLVELSFVLLLTALLIGTVLKGQEVIFSARVRTLLSEHEGARAAWLGFQDRYRALPGDYASAAANITGVSKAGNGNGRIETDATPTRADGVSKEYALVWEHLSKSRFLASEYVYSADLTFATVSRLAPRNLFGGFVDLAYDDRYGNPSASRPVRHTLKTGNFLPAAMLAEMDRKTDDGKAFSGGFQFSNFAWFDPRPPRDGANACVDPQGNWRVTDEAQAMNCGGASLL
jgi:hypothetical protein